MDQFLHTYLSYILFETGCDEITSFIRNLNKSVCRTDHSTSPTLYVILLVFVVSS